MSSQNSFLNITQQGKNGWLRYLLGIITIFGIVLLSILAYGYIIYCFFNIPIKELFLLSTKDPILLLFVFNLYSLSLVTGIYIATEKIHKKKFKTLFSSRGTIDWLRIVRGSVLWLITYFATWILLYIIHPSRYQLIFNFSEWIPLAFIYLVLSVFGSFSIIIFLYSYLLQGIYSFIRNRVLAIIILSAIISTFFIDLEYPEYWIANFIFSLFFTLIVIKDNRIELAVGMHIPNLFLRNSFLAPLKSNFVFSAVFETNGESNIFFYLMICIIRFSLFYFLCFHISKKRGVSNFN
ncbi:hypothetical protein [Acaryochloris sp. IP29b_bin.148]|uniref:hypothetical protein n=1 Tax=Acaryochloris sp. IP29b_bin.148 TaxID=2969218 RepID=UPI0026090B76|nr:hypothetical protein [Acaryochloris sp. IP29b_bin.148]